MPRLPVPGGDGDSWGLLLNEFLRVAHNEDGSLSCAPLDVLAYASVDRGGEISYRHEGTIKNALDVVDDAERAFCLSPGEWHIQADLTLPQNVTLYVMRGAVLKIATGVTLQIGGYIAAGAYKIFEYSGSGRALWAYSLSKNDAAPEHGSRQVLYPEWWGAIASKTHDKRYEAQNTAAFNAMFAVPGSGNHARRAQLQPGGIYHVNDTIRILEWFSVYGEHSQIRSSLNSEGRAVVQIGARAENKKVFYMEWRGVDVQYSGVAPSKATGILIDHSDFGIFHNSIVGGWDVGIKSGIGSVNEWTFRNILVVGCRIGYSMGQQPTAAAPSVSTWEGGKIQQCTELGMHLENMSQFELRGLDFSLNDQGSIRLVNCAAFRVSVYTEAIGFWLQPTPHNEWKNIHLIGCNGWVIEHLSPLSLGVTQWEVGDRCFNSAPTPGGVSGWVCTSAGSPGVWKAFGAIEG
jgi:hypothetical protein